MHEGRHKLKNCKVVSGTWKFRHKKNMLNRSIIDVDAKKSVWYFGSRLKPRSPPPRTMNNKGKQETISNIKRIYSKCLDIDCLLCRLESATHFLGWASPGRTPCNNAAHYCAHVLQDIPTTFLLAKQKWKRGVGRHSN